MHVQMGWLTPKTSSTSFSSRRCSHEGEGATTRTRRKSTPASFFARLSVQSALLDSEESNKAFQEER